MIKLFKNHRSLNFTDVANAKPVERHEVGQASGIVAGLNEEEKKRLARHECGWWQPGST